MSKAKNILLIILAFFAGSIASIFATIAFAHGGNTSLIHGCVGTGGLNQGRLRIIAANGTCNANETPLDWNIQGVQGPPGPAGQGTGGFVSDLNGASLTNVDFRYRNYSGTNFSGADFGPANSSNIFDHTDFSNANFTNVNFIGTSSQYWAFQFTNFSNANFTSTSLEFFGCETCNLSNIDLSNRTLNDIVFYASNLTNVNFSNSTLTRFDLRQTNMTGANLTGVTWVNTLCPDETNSDNNGNTCIGHLTP